MHPLWQGLLILVLVIGANLTAQSHRIGVDLAEIPRNALSSQTRQALANLREPVTVTAFFRADKRFEAEADTRDLLQLYQADFPNFSIRKVDPIANPDLVRKFGLDEASVAGGAVVFDGTRGRFVVSADEIAQNAEAALTGAALAVTGRRLPVLYLSAHDDNGRSDYALAEQLLGKALFDVRPIELESVSKVPANAAAVMLLGGRRALSDHERGVLAAFLDHGGRLLVTLDPFPEQSLERFLASRGVEVRDGVIIDFESNAAGNVADLLLPADRNAFGIARVRLPGVAPVRPSLDVPDDLAVIALGSSSANAAISRDLSPSHLPSAAPADRASLPVGLLIAWPGGAERSRSTGARLAVLGDSDFARNAFIGDGGNAAFLATTMKWLAAGKPILTVPQRVTGERRFLVTPSEVRFIGLSSVLLLPALVLAGGLVMAMRR